MKLRALSLDTAASLPAVGEIEEALRWGEPAYLTSATKSGSAVRINRKKSSASQYAMYFQCQTTLVETFRTLFPRELRFEGNRAIVFEVDEELPMDTLAFCVEAALTYHLRKKAAAF
jgi:hypothetical protein